MSLLMQALKKAERAKQNALAEEELDKPSEAFDEVLALTPEPAPVPAPGAARGAGSLPATSTSRAPVEFSLEPMEGLSLEPLAPPVAASGVPRPSPSPLPPPSDHQEPGLTMDLALDPVVAPAPADGRAAAASPRSASAAPSAQIASADLAPGPVAAAATSAAAAGFAAGAQTTAHATASPAASAGSGHSTRAATAAGGNAAAAASTPTGGYGTATDRNAPLEGYGTAADHNAAIVGHGAAPYRNAPDAGHGTATDRTAPIPGHGAAAGGSAAAGGKRAAGSGNGAQGGGNGGTRGGAAARARARTAAAAGPTGLDPERLRLIVLLAILLLLVGGFGIYYWRAITGPGAGAGLPPVPMPPAGATGATPGSGSGQIIIANGSPAPNSADPAGAPGASAASDLEADALMVPSAGSSRTQQELERRIAKTEQELAAAQQALQAAAQPRAEQMPVLAAPANNDIRVTRIVQPAPVSPTLDGAYRAFNNGDLAGAQQQYDAALAQDANNRDALLGAAHVAARQNQKDRAAGYYLRLLELSPNDADATAGLIGLRQGNISQSEARLKAILANNPDAGPVLFALGNLYAQQGRWPDAQQAYFRAFGAAPDNPEYAYNLAIGLDRLNQGKLALSYYQRALALAQDKTVGFDRNALRVRMHELSVATH